MPKHSQISMLVENHHTGEIVQLADGSRWRIWPCDVPIAAMWFPGTRIEKKEIKKELCSHCLTNQSTGKRVGAIPFHRRWQIEELEAWAEKTFAEVRQLAAELSLPEIGREQSLWELGELPKKRIPRDRCRSRCSATLRRTT